MRATPDRFPRAVRPEVGPPPCCRTERGLAQGSRVLPICVVLALAGCAPAEIRLWPILDVQPATGGRSPAERDAAASAPAAESPSGVHVEALWPFFELDTTGASARHALRPLYHWDGVARRGGVAWPFVEFAAGDTPFFALFPLYFVGRDGEERSWHHLFPIAGAFRNGPRRTFYATPWFETDDGERAARGLIVPPFLWGETRDGSSRWRLWLNTYWSHSTTTSFESRPFAPSPSSDEEIFAGIRRTEDTAAFLPLVFRHREEHEPLAVEGAPAPRGWRTDSLLVIPSYLRERHWRGGDLAIDDTHLFPLYHRSWRPDRQRLALGDLPWPSFEGIRIVHPFATSTATRDGETSSTLELFPFYAQRTSPVGTWHEIPGLGLGWGRGERARLGIAGPQRGFSWWPMFAWAVRDEGPAAEGDTPWAWQAAAGFARYRRDASGWSTSLLWGLHEDSVQGEGEARRSHHRFWPLYRANSSAEGTEVTALAEIFQFRTGSELRGDLGFLLHPVTYQSTRDGDRQLRIAWKLIEVERQGTTSSWAVQPLVYHHRDEGGDHRTLLLGGLAGWGRRQDAPFARLLWLFDLPL